MIKMSATIENPLVLLPQGNLIAYGLGIRRAAEMGGHPTVLNWEHAVRVIGRIAAGDASLQATSEHLDMPAREVRNNLVRMSVHLGARTPAQLVDQALKAKIVGSTLGERVYLSPPQLRLLELSAAGHPDDSIKEELHQQGLMEHTSFNRILDGLYRALQLEKAARTRPAAVYAGYNHGIFAPSPQQPFRIAVGIPTTQPYATLQPIHKRILYLRARGLTNGQIGQKMRTTEDDIKGYIQDSIGALGSSTTGAITRSVIMGDLPLDPATDIPITAETLVHTRASLENGILAALGWKNEKISQLTVTSMNTVKTHIRRMLLKLDIKGRESLAPPLFSLDILTPLHNDPFVPLRRPE